LVCSRSAGSERGGVSNTMWHVLWALVLLVAVGHVEGQPQTSKHAPVTPKRGVVAPPPAFGGASVPARPTPTPAPQAAPSTTTPFRLSGQTVCEHGTAVERPAEERPYWFDGATVGLPGHRCITLQ
jgi:hypothetical protein